MTNDPTKKILFCLGEKVFDSVTVLDPDNLMGFEFIDIEDEDHFFELMEKWNSFHFAHRTTAIIVHDSYVRSLAARSIDKKKNASAMRNVPLLVFSNVKKESIANLCFSISADDYIYGELTFAKVIFKIGFAKRLKALGVSKHDAEINQNQSYKMHFFKRAFDILISASALLALSPIMILVALIIRLESKGPIFYISKRAGRLYQVFDFYKFRSMQVDADKLLAKLKETSNQYQDGNQFVKIKDDPRITKFGSFIRNTSLDELPQLINVLKGDMSIVGNRPLPLYEAELLTTDDHAERFLAPAGITGLWQTMKRGKGEMSSEERITLDRIYVRKNSFWFDMRLIFKTVPALLQSEKV